MEKRFIACMDCRQFFSLRMFPVDKLTCPHNAEHEIYEISEGLYYTVQLVSSAIRQSYSVWRK